MQVLLHEIAFIKMRSFEDMLQEMGDWVLDEDNDDAITDDANNNHEGDEAVDGQIGATAIRDGVGNIIRAVIQTASGMLARIKSYMARRSGLKVGTIPAAAALESHDSGEDNAMFHFQHFDVVRSPQDHHYLEYKEKVHMALFHLLYISDVSFAKNNFMMILFKWQMHFHSISLHFTQMVLIHIPRLAGQRWWK